jgi:hypothetical protein
MGCAVTEAEWLACDDPRPMFPLVRRKASSRKLRLLAVACARTDKGFWRIIRADERRVIELAERFADDPALWGEVKALRLLDYCQGVRWCAGCRPAPSRWIRSNSPKPERAECRPAEARLLRDIFGNLFRPVAINAAWLAWNDGTVVKMAQSIYDERAFDRLPILADALEEAGCHDPEILGHCRQPGEHVRGCWIVDLILGKE